MFDVSFSELIVIGIVALIVIGPEKLPKVARTVGLLAGRVQRYVTDVKSDIERELQLEDLKKIQNEIRQESQQAYNALNQIHSDAQQTIQSVSQDVAGAVKQEGGTPNQNLPTTGTEDKK